MKSDYKKTWETYVASWKAESVADKRALFATSLAPACRYTDPMIATTGTEELAEYMVEFHKQVPGGHFVTTWFLSHHDRSVAKWNMVGIDGTVLGDGVSYGEYNVEGLLVAMTGFYETAG